MTQRLVQLGFIVSMAVHAGLVAVLWWGLRATAGNPVSERQVAVELAMFAASARISPPADAPPPSAEIAEPTQAHAMGSMVAPPVDVVDVSLEATARHARRTEPREAQPPKPEPKPQPTDERTAPSERRRATAGPSRAATQPAMRRVESQRGASPVAAVPAVEEAAQPAGEAAATRDEAASNRSTQHADLRGAYKAKLLAAIARRKYYPGRARRRRIEGEVKVGFTVQADGTLTHVRLVASSGYELLDAAALTALQRLAQVDPIPAELAMTEWGFVVPIVFALRY